MCTCKCHDKTPDRHCDNCEYGEFLETKLDQILDNYAQQYYQLLRTPTIEAKEIKDRKRNKAKQAIEQLIIQARIQAVEITEIKK